MARHARLSFTINRGNVIKISWEAEHGTTKPSTKLWQAIPNLCDYMIKDFVRTHWRGPCSGNGTVAEVDGVFKFTFEPGNVSPVFSNAFFKRMQKERRAQEYEKAKKLAARKLKRLKKKGATLVAV